MKVVTYKHRIYLIGLMHLIFWLVNFAFIEDVNNKYFWLLEQTWLIFDSLLIFILLIRNKGWTEILAILIFASFSFARPFDSLTTPQGLVVALVIISLGILLNLFFYRTQFKIDKISIGILSVCIACIFGGGFYQHEFLVEQVIFCILITLVILLFYLFFLNKYQSISFSKIAYLFVIFGLFIFFQEIVAIIMDNNLITDTIEKSLSVGWGKSNNIALMLLLVFPFPIYFYIKSKNPIYELSNLIIASIFALGIFLTLSRGCIGILIISIIPITVFTFLSKKDKWKRELIIYAIILGFVILVLLMMLIFSRNYLYTLFSNMIKGLQFSSLNGRLIIYKTFWDLAIKKPMFGYGVYYPFMESININFESYQWAHSTFLHTFFTMGIIGLLALLFHVFQKYYYLLKEPTVAKITLFLSFLLSGLYGLFDVSYYFIPYTVVLIIIMILCKNFYNEKKFR